MTFSTWSDLRIIYYFCLFTDFKMVVDKESIMNIMGGMENSVGVRLHNHRKKLRQR